MSGDIRGLHHITALSGDAQGNLDFYVRALGLRLVKKTVNFDAPDVYHLYYGDERGDAGTVMTFFPFPNARRGQVGTGQVSVTQFAVPAGALDFWAARLPEHGARIAARETAFGEARLIAEDPEGLPIALVETGRDDSRMPWLGEGIPAEAAIRGFRGATLAVRSADAAAMEAILTGLFGYAPDGEEPSGAGTVRRFSVAGGNPASVIDLRADDGIGRGIEAAGTVHHIAFSVPDRAAQERVRAAIAAAGHDVTPRIDRDYFYSIYFRTPGGILFEVATEEPGFTVDEPLEHLGEELRLPDQHAHLRERLEQTLPPLET